MTNAPTEAAAPSFADMPRDPTALHRWLLPKGRLDALRARLTLSDIVAETLPLEPAEHGEMRGSCPHPEHDDDRKAFFVNDARGFFHCFGCGIHGDAIRWMTDHRDTPYVEAVETLARRASLLP